MTTLKLQDNEHGGVSLIFENDDGEKIRFDLTDKQFDMLCEWRDEK